MPLPMTTTVFCRLRITPDILLGILRGSTELRVNRNRRANFSALYGRIIKPKPAKELEDMDEQSGLGLQVCQAQSHGSQCLHRRQILAKTTSAGTLNRCSEV